MMMYTFFFKVSMHCFKIKKNNSLAAMCSVAGVIHLVRHAGYYSSPHGSSNFGRYPGVSLHSLDIGLELLPFAADFQCYPFCKRDTQAFQRHALGTHVGRQCWLFHNLNILLLQERLDSTCCVYLSIVMPKHLKTMKSQLWNHYRLKSFVNVDLGIDWVLENYVEESDDGN